MKYFTWIMALLLVSSAGYAQINNIADAIAEAPGVLDWHFRVFVAFPKNVEAFNKAVEEKRSHLKIGEQKEFYVLMRKDNEGNPLSFVGLQAVGSDFLTDTETVEVAKIKIQRAQYQLAAPLMPFTQKMFSSIYKGTQVTYLDHLFSVDYINKAMGFSGVVSIFVDLLQTEIRTGAHATVILVSKENSKNYQVFDVDNGKTAGYPKKDFLSRLGNSIWLLSLDGQYTIVYQNLAAINIQLGQRVNIGDILGKFKSPEKTSGSWQIWRVKNRDQRFLRDGAYRVWPLGG